MIGLLYKDNITIFKAYKGNALLVLAVYALLSIGMNASFFLCALIFMFGMYAMFSLNFDENSHWDCYARTLPVSAGQIVASKYISTLLWALLATVVCLILTPILTLVHGPSANPATELASMLAAFGVVLFYNAVTAPLSYKFSAVKSRSYTMMAMGCFISLVVLLGNMLPQEMRASLLAISEEQVLSFLAVALVFLMLSFLASWYISTKIYERKEF